MLTVPDIGPLISGISAAPNAHRPQEAAIAFDTMVLELLLRQSGVMQSLAAGEDASLPLMSEMLLQDIAGQLAAQVDLGFGSLLLSQAAGLSKGGAL